jgi:alkylation response protein AidB-like acyl-CoA dehydrogenase
LHQPAPELLHRVQRTPPRIRLRSDEIEASRELPQDLVEAITSAGLFQSWVPRSAGGYEVDPAINLRAIEELSRPTPRALRDAHTMVHHRSVCLPTYTWIGRMLLGRVPRKAVLVHFA